MHSEYIPIEGLLGVEVLSQSVFENEYANSAKIDNVEDPFVCVSQPDHYSSIDEYCEAFGHESLLSWYSGTGKCV